MCRLIFASLLLLMSCSRAVYTPLERVSRDSVGRVSDREAMFYVLDSISVTTAGDTVRENRLRIIMRDIVSHDTLYMARGDTLTVERRELASSGRRFGFIGVIVFLALIVLLRLLK